MNVVTDIIDPLHLGLALGPLSVYLLLLGMLNLSSRPYVTTGARDTAALGVGISGLIIVGPLQLLLPTATLYQWGPLVWPLLLAFYGLMLTLTVLLMRPRLVVYNLSADRIRPVLAALVSELDSEARWAGSCLVMPQLGVQLHVESVTALRNVQLVAAGPHQSYDGWRRLERGLVEALRETRATRNPFGISLVASSVFLITVLGLCLVQEANTVAAAMLHLWKSVE